MNDDDDLTGILAEVPEIATSPLSVIVDFNDLYERLGEEATFDLIGKLKDLLA